MRLLIAALLTLAASAAANPLLTVAQLKPGQPIPFDQIRPEHVLPAVQQLLAQAEKDRDALKAAPRPLTWDNTIAPLETLGDPLNRAFRMVATLESLATTPDLRKAFNAALPLVRRFDAGIDRDPLLAQRVKEYSETTEAKSLTGPRTRALELTLDRFRRNGAYLDDAQRARLQAIDDRLTSLSARFGQNVLDSTNSFELLLTDERQLAGLPESARRAAAASARSKGKSGWRFTLQTPSYLPALRFLDDPAIRRQLSDARAAVATAPPFDNRPIMKEILELRREKAALLGFATFADLQTGPRMAQSGGNVLKFLNTLDEKARPAFEKETAELQAFRRSLEGPNAPPLESWDLAYYSEKLRKSLYDFDEEQIRPYLPMNKVLDGMFAHAGRIFGIQVKPVANSAVWDPAVQYFAIHDRDGALLAHFYFDFHPRENKRSGAWMSPIWPAGLNAKGQFEPHLGLIAGNVTPPLDGKPALLNHREVITLFHEFGHLLHLALSRSPVPSLSGIRVAWDFVELPSQIMENFTWERPVVDLFARHFETGNPLPEELFAKMLKARNFRSASGIMSLLGGGMADILLHTQYTGNDQQGDIIAYTSNIYNRYSAAPLPRDHGRIAAFSHIFSGGYAAGYYSYQWAQVLDADAFTRFKRDGVFSESAGAAFRRSVLEKGNSEPPQDLFRQFLGRDPDISALLERSGLTGAR